MLVLHERTDAQLIYAILYVNVNLHVVHCVYICIYHDTA